MKNLRSHHAVVDKTPAARRDEPVGWGAAIIDERGNEVPITEAMIQRACDELADTWAYPRISAR